MAIDWDAELLGPIMSILGEGSADDPSSWPIYFPERGGRLPLPGAVFDAAYQRTVDLGESVTQSSAHPILGVRDAVFQEAGLPPPSAGEAVLIPSTGKTYRVVNPEPDGHGHTLLILMVTDLGNR